MMRKRHRQIFWQDSCSLANSYYFDKNGDVPLRPATTLRGVLAQPPLPARAITDSPRNCASRVRDVTVVRPETRYAEADGVRIGYQAIRLG